MNQDNRSQLPEHEGVDAGGAWDLNGDLARMPLISVLQFLEVSRQTGVLVVTADTGVTHRCFLGEGAIVDASSRHLRGWEAALAVLELRAGRFAFGARDAHPGTERINVSPLVMEAVRLEDELERLSPFLPEDDSPLVLRNADEIPIDPLESGADTIMASIAARPRATLRQLEQTVPLSPGKLRLSVAWLSSTGRLRSRGSVTMQVPARRGHWYSKLQVFYPGGLRVLVGTIPERGAHEILEAVTALAKELDSGPAWMSLTLDGAAIARVRPSAGGLLSLASLPMTAANERPFRTFANTAGLVLVCAEAPAGMLAKWKAMVPGRVALRLVRCGGDGLGLRDALRQHAEGLESGVVGRPEERRP